jgi:hypothetical protein
MRGYTYPTSVSEAKDVLPSAYAPSALTQIGSLGTLLAAGSGKDGLFTKGFEWLKNLDLTKPGGGLNLGNSEAGNEAGTGFDSSGNPII